MIAAGIFSPAYRLVKDIVEAGYGETARSIRPQNKEEPNSIVSLQLTFSCGDRPAANGNAQLGRELNRPRCGRTNIISACFLDSFSDKTRSSRGFS